jgi:hypothetical protein
MSDPNAQKKGIYSPTQVYITTFLGGPFMGFFVLWSNFRAMGKTDSANHTLIWGAVCNVLFLGIFLIPIPKSFPNILIPIIYSVIFRQFAESQQMTRDAIRNSETFTFQSWWKAIGIAIAFLIPTLILYFVVVFIYAALGLIKLDQS